jgi:mannose-6-phosphate isomerase-like protein (cupin superfamily)
MHPRISFLAPLTALAAAVAVAAGDVAPRPHYFAPAEVDAARAAGDTGSALLQEADFKILASRRDRPGQSEVHATDTDIFVVIDGRATIVLGGKMLDPHEVSPGEIRGSGIEGGTDYLLEKGAVLTVPRNTPHWVRETRPGFRYYVIKSVQRG